MAKDRAARYRLRFPVAYDDGEGFMTGYVVDVSESGLFIETVLPLKEGTRVRITPLLPEKAGLFELEAEVVRTKEYDPDSLMELPPGMGVRFLSISDEERKNLTQLFAASEVARKLAQQDD